MNVYVCMYVQIYIYMYLYIKKVDVYKLKSMRVTKT